MSTLKYREARSGDLSDAKKEAEALFRNRTIADIAQIEAGTRKVINEKKQELRQVVGESYRDLISSADLILDMVQESARTLSNIKSIQQQFAALEDRVVPDRGSGAAQDNSASSATGEHQLYAVGERVKYLVDTPEAIWGFLDNQDFLQAALRYLRARTVHSMLTDGSHADALGSFLLVTTQWPNIEKQKDEIASRAQQYLTESESMPAAAVAAALAALAFLRSLQPSEVLPTLLSARLCWADTLLAETISPGPDDNRLQTVLDRLTKHAHGILTSLLQVGQLFLEGGGLLRGALADRELDAAELLFPHWSSGSAALPGTEQASPEAEAWTALWEGTLAPALQPLRAAAVEKLCSGWLQDVAASTSTKASTLLQDCNTAMDLAELEQGVQAAIAQWREPQPEAAGMPAAARELLPEPRDGLQVIELVLGRRAALWEMVYEQPLLQQAKSLLQRELGTLQQLLAEPLAQALSAAGTAPTQLPGQVLLPSWPPPAFGRAATQGRHAGSGSSAAEKVVQQVHAVPLSTFQGTLQLAGISGADASGSLVGGSMSAFWHRRAPGGAAGGNAAPAAALQARRLAELGPFLQEHCTQAALAIAAQLEDRLSEVSESVLAGDGAAVERALLIGQLAQAVGEQGSALHAIMLPSEAWPAALQQLLQAQAAAGRQLPGGSSTAAARPKASALPNTASPRMQALQEAFWKVKLRAYRRWAVWVAGHLADALAADLGSCPLLLLNTTPPSWADTVIPAEDGLGDAGEMRFPLPVAPSPPTSAFLSAACNDLQRIGGPAIDREVLSMYLWELAQAVLPRLAAAAAPPAAEQARLTEKGVLQLLFDVRVLRDALAGGHPPAAAPGAPGEAAAGSSRANGGVLGREEGAAALLFSEHAGSSSSTVMEAAAASKQRWQQVEQALSGQLDPIDWATYEPFLWQNQQLHLQRVATLMGGLLQLSSAKDAAAPKMQGASSTADINILNLLPIAPRFPLLPVSSNTISSPSASGHRLRSHSPFAAARPGLSQPLPAPHAGAAALPRLASGGEHGFYSFADLNSIYRSAGAAEGGGGIASGSQAEARLDGSKAVADGGAGSSAADASSSTWASIQARLAGAPALGSLGSLLGDRAADLSGRAQQRLEALRGGLGTNLQSPLLSSLIGGSGSGSAAAGVRATL